MSRAAVFVLLLVLGAGWTPRGSAETNRGSAETKRKSGDRSCSSLIKSEFYETELETAISLVSGTVFLRGSTGEVLRKINQLACFLLEGRRRLPVRNQEGGPEYYPLRDFSDGQYAIAKRIACKQHPALANIRPPKFRSEQQARSFLKEIKERFPQDTKKLKFRYDPPTRRP